MTQRKIQYWVIPPQADAEFVAHMEQVLDLYQKPYDPDCPVVCMDEQPVQLVKETRPPMAATKNRPRRVDYEYERAGTAAVFLFSEPLAGWRQATARARRTKVDWALEVAGLLEGRYAECPKITLVCDHLSAVARKSVILDGTSTTTCRGCMSEHRRQEPVWTSGGGAGVKAVSPAERGRSEATRLDVGEHTRTLLG